MRGGTGAAGGRQRRSRCPSPSPGAHCWVSITGAHHQVPIIRCSSPGVCPPYIGHTAQSLYQLVFWARPQPGCAAQLKEGREFLLSPRGLSPLPSAQDNPPAEAAHFGETCTPSATPPLHSSDAPQIMLTDSDGILLLDPLNSSFLT